tara:strand:- start:213 stop:707 length:495 start_codon:yes stop_codon:yes gene_type:complete
MDWIKTLTTVAPFLATAFGGPLAGAATKFVAANLLGDDSAGIAEIESAILGADPEQLAKLKNIDNDFRIEMMKIDAEIFKTEVEGKKSARIANVHSCMPAILSVALTMFIVLIVLALFYVEPPTGAREVLFMLLGVVIKEWSNSLHYWYGSTRSSQIKTEMMKR